MLIRRFAKIATVLVLATTLSGCKIMGITIFGFNDKIKVNNFDSFNERVMELEVKLDEEYGFGSGNEFYKNLLKIGAYRGLKIDDIDLSRGLVEVDVKSVLPDGRYGQLQSAYSVLSNDLIDGIRVEDIRKTAEALEKDAVLRYTKKVEILESDIEQKIKNINEYLDRTKTLLGTVSVSGDATVEILEDSNNFRKFATIRTEILNGSSYNIKEMKVNFKVLDPRADNAIIAENITTVSFDRKISDGQIRFSRDTSRLDVGEKVKVQVDIFDGDLTQLQTGLYNVVGDTYSLITTTNEVISNEELVFALNQAEKIKSKIIEYKEQIYKMFSGSF